MAGRRCSTCNAIMVVDEPLDTPGLVRYRCPSCRKTTVTQEGARPPKLRYGIRLKQQKWI